MQTSKTPIQEIQKTLQYTFLDQDYLSSALGNQITNGVGTQRPFTYSRNSLAATGELIMRTAFLSEGSSLNLFPDPHSRQLDQSRLAVIGCMHGLDCLREVSRSGDRDDASVATIVKAIVGAVFLDSSRSMDAARSVMKSLGFHLIQARENIELEKEPAVIDSHPSQTTFPDCVGSPDCGCGCLWLDQFISAGWRASQLNSATPSSSAHELPSVTSPQF